MEAEVGGLHNFENSLDYVMRPILKQNKGRKEGRKWGEERREGKGKESRKEVFEQIFPGRKSLNDLKIH